MTPTSEPVETLQQVLDVEHAAVYGYGVVGAHLGGGTRAEALAAHDAHRARRDELARLVSERGATPVGAAPAYELPGPVKTVEQARDLAVRLEESVTVAYARLVADSSGELRLTAATALREAAVRAARWRTGSVAFPGLPDLRPSVPTSSR